MSHRRSSTRAGLAFLCIASAGCFTSGENGDPGAGFSSGTGNYGYGGSYASGTAGSSASGAGGTTGVAGTGVVGSTCTGAAGTASTGAGGSTDGGAATEAGASTEAGMETEAGAATDAGTTTEVGPTTDAGADTAGTTDAAARSSTCPAGGTAAFSLAWTLEDATGADSSCDMVGGKTVDIQVVNAVTCAVTTTTVSCAALAATTCALPPGTYSVSLKLRGAAGNVLSEIFAPTLFLEDGQTSTVASLPLQVGGDATKGRGFALTWSLEQAGTMVAETCAQAGAAKVRLFAGTTSFDLSCADGKGRTTAIAPGTYPVSLHLIDASGADLSVTQTMSLSIAAGQLVFLGDVPFDI